MFNAYHGHKMSMTVCYNILWNNNIWLHFYIQCYVYIILVDTRNTVAGVDYNLWLTLSGFVTYKNIFLESAMCIYIYYYKSLKHMPSYIWHTERFGISTL